MGTYWIGLDLDERIFKNGSFFFNSSSVRRVSAPSGGNEFSKNDPFRDIWPVLGPGKREQANITAAYAVDREFANIGIYRGIYRGI